MFKSLWRNRTEMSIFGMAKIFDYKLDIIYEFSECSSKFLLTIVISQSFEKGTQLSCTSSTTYNTWSIVW